MVKKKLRFHALLHPKKKDMSFYLGLIFPVLTKPSISGFNKYKGVLQLSKPTSQYRKCPTGSE